MTTEQKMLALADRLAASRGWTAKGYRHPPSGTVKVRDGTAEIRVFDYHDHEISIYSVVSRDDSRGVTITQRSVSINLSARKSVENLLPDCRPLHTWLDKAIAEVDAQVEALNEQHAQGEVSARALLVEFPGAERHAYSGGYVVKLPSGHTMQIKVAAAPGCYTINGIDGCRVLTLGEVVQIVACVGRCLPEAP
jgi:hypothetical protein